MAASPDVVGARSCSIRTAELICEVSRAEPPGTGVVCSYAGRTARGEYRIQDGPQGK